MTMCPDRCVRAGAVRPRAAAAVDRPAAMAAACRRPSRLSVVGLASWLLLFTAAPVAGDIGSCGQAIEELDPAKFFTEKQRVDCEQCQSCSIGTDACVRACAGEPVPTAFEEGCYPLAHDGEVCLAALRAASCSEYERYVTDAAPETPTECNFCPLAERPGGP